MVHSYQHSSSVYTVAIKHSHSVSPFSAPHMVFLAKCNSINSHQLSPPPLFSCWTCQVMFRGSCVWLRPPSPVWEKSEVGSVGRDLVWPGHIGTELHEVGKQLQLSPYLLTLLLISPLSVCRYSFHSLFCFNTVFSIPVPGHYTRLYLFMYQETEMDSHPGKRGEREVKLWLCAHGCVFACMCTRTHAAFALCFDEWYSI